VFTTESDSDSTPFNAKFGSSQAKDFSEKNQQRLVQDKRLNNYLMQAQKMMQKRSSALDQTEAYKSQGLPELRTIVVEDTELDFRAASRIDSSVQKAESQEINTIFSPQLKKNSTKFESIRKSCVAGGARICNDSEALEPIEEVKGARRKNTDQSSSGSRPDENRQVSRGKTMPLSAKHDGKQEINFGGLQGAKLRQVVKASVKAKPAKGTDGKTKGRNMMIDAKPISSQTKELKKGDDMSSVKTVGQKTEKSSMNRTVAGLKQTLTLQSEINQSLDS